MLLCSVAAACGSSDTTVRTVAPLTFVAPVADADAGEDPGAAAADTTTTVLEPVADRLPADPEAPAADWVAGINAAGWAFHRHLKGNAVSSPISIGVAFSLSRAGASADSGAVLDKIFGFPEVGLHGAANAVDLRLAEASAGPTTLEVANRLFPDDGFSPLPEFLHTAAAQYGAVVQPIDTADGAAAAETVNRWVSQSTRGLIPTIVTESAVQGQELVLVNTVYLKADWTEPFLPEYTRDGQFTTSDNRSVTVPFMRRSHRHGLRRIRTSPGRSHDRRRPALPVGHHPPRHRCSPVRGPPRRTRRVAQQPGCHQPYAQ